MLVILIVAILYHARRKLLIREDNNIYQKAEKIPQENDERFATGKSFMIYRFLWCLRRASSFFTKFCDLWQLAWHEMKFRIGEIA